MKYHCRLGHMQQEPYATRISGSTFMATINTRVLSASYQGMYTIEKPKCQHFYDFQGIQGHQLKTPASQTIIHQSLHSILNNQFPHALQHHHKKYMKPPQNSDNSTEQNKTYLN